jgi:hypothetical protein
MAYLIVNDVIAAQTPQIETPFLEILPDFDLIIEIGFHRGALSQWLYTNKNPQTKLYCYDVVSDEKQINNENINFIIGDCFNDEVILSIQNLINESGKSLILCDGGSKNNEFNLYSQFLKSDDVIMCHDYSHSNEDFELVVQQLGWGHISESDYASISNSVTNNNLIPYKYDNFKNVLWGSFIKQ